MSKYRIKVSFDGENFFWIVIDNGKLIKDPTKEDLKETKLKFYNKTNICDKCREELKIEYKELIDKSILYPGNAVHNIDEKGNRTEEWVCLKHYGRNYNIYDPDSWNNIKKSLRDRRTGNLRDSDNILGDNSEDLTEKWLGAERLSVKYDIYASLPLDHGPVTKHINVKIGNKLVDLYGKIPQTKASTISIVIKDGVYDTYEYEMWHHALYMEHDKTFDILIFYCFNEEGKTIERIYIIPYSEILKRKSIGIYKNVKNCSIRWYEKYLMEDEKELKFVNKILSDIIKMRRIYI